MIINTNQTKYYDCILILCQYWRVLYENKFIILWQIIQCFCTVNFQQVHKYANIPREKRKSNPQLSTKEQTDFKLCIPKKHATFLYTHMAWKSVVWVKNYLQDCNFFFFFFKMTRRNGKPTVVTPTVVHPVDSTVSNRNDPSAKS